MLGCNFRCTQCRREREVAVRVCVCVYVCVCVSVFMYFKSFNDSVSNLDYT